MTSASRASVSGGRHTDEIRRVLGPRLEALARNPAAAEAVLQATGDQRVQDLLRDI